VGSLIAPIAKIPDVIKTIPWDRVVDKKGKRAISADWGGLDKPAKGNANFDIPFGAGKAIPNS